MQKTAVIGAGVFGIWSAYELQRQGHQVTLIDVWGPGNSRSSSGGESRVIRAVYGTDELYVAMVRQAFGMWRDFEKEHKCKLLKPANCLWLFESANDEYARKAIPLLMRHGFGMEELSPAEVQKRYPLISTDGVLTAFIEKEAGSLLARKACCELLIAFVAAGGKYVEQLAQPGAIKSGRMEEIHLSDNSKITADQYVFACGPWLPQLFPEILQPHLNISRQEIFYFGAPSGSYHQLPIWLNVNASTIYYGIPDADGRGFKIADDTRGAPFDPTFGHRVPGEKAIEKARRFLAHRFPGLANAPLLESRVCQYTNSPDGHYVIDRHPLADNVWLAGAGCGHAFKMGPALGRYVAELVSGRAGIKAEFALDRLARTSPGTTQFDHY